MKYALYRRYGSHLSDATTRLFAYCGHNAVVVLDTLTLSVIDVLKGHNNRATAVAFIDSSGNCLISAASDKSVRLWLRHGDGEGRFMCRRALGKRPAEVKAITSTSLGGVVLGDVAGNLFSWNTAIPNEKMHRLEACKQGSAIMCLAPSPVPSLDPESCIVAVGCASGEVSIVDWKRGVVLRSLEKHSTEVHALRWARLLAGSSSSSSSSGSTNSESDTSTADVDLLVSTSSDRSILVYKTEEHRGKTSSKGEDSDLTEEASCAIVNTRVLSKMLLPPPHGGIGKGQKGRLWLPAAWCPVVCDDGVYSSAVLVTGGFGGAFYSWKIPLAPSSSSSCGAQNCSLEQVKGDPVRISTVHTRTVFSLHCFLDPGARSSGGISTKSVTKGAATGTVADSSSGLHMLTIGMDRTAAATWTPLPLSAALSSSNPPAASAAAASDAATSSAKAGEATSTASTTTIKSVSVATCTGLGAHPQSFAAEQKLVRLGIDHLHRLAVACGDSTIRLLEFSQQPLTADWSNKNLFNPTSTLLLWQGIPSPVTAVTWHPIEEDIIVWGCVNGSIGLAHCKKGTCILAPTKHAGPVTVLDWVNAPFPLEEVDYLSSDNESGWDDWEDGDCSLVSFSSAGDVLQWKVWKELAELFPPARRHPGGGVQTQEAPVRRELGTPEDITCDYSDRGPIMCIEGDRNQTDFVVGGQGGITIVDLTAQKKYAVRQHPTASPVVNASIACATRAVTVHEDGSLFIAVPRLFGPNDPTYQPAQLSPEMTVTALASCVFPLDASSNELHIWAALGTKEGSVQLWRAPWTGGDLQHMRTLRGHGSTVLKLGWIHISKVTSQAESTKIGMQSPILLSSAEDQTVRAWDIAACIAQPPTTDATLPVLPAMPAVVEETTERQDEEEEEEEIPPPPPQPVSMPVVATEEYVVVERHGEKEEEDKKEHGAPAAEESVAPPLTKPPTSTSSSTSGPGKMQKRDPKQVTLGSKSLLLPTKSASDNTLHQEALHIAVVQLAERAAALAGGGENTRVGNEASLMGALQCPLDCFDASSALSHTTDELLQQEGLAKLAPQQRRLQAHRAAAVALWAGDVGQSIRILTDASALTADFVSFAASAGRAVWEAVSRAYAAQLEEAEEVHLAALYLLSVGDPSAACAVYSRNGMVREAATLAAAKLPASDPETQKLRSVYAAKLEARGEYEYAAGEYLAAQQGVKAVQSLEKRNTASALRAAAQLRRVILGDEEGGVDDGGAAATTESTAERQSVTTGIDNTAGSHSMHGASRKRYGNEEMLAVGALAAQKGSRGKKSVLGELPPSLRRME